MNEFDERYMWLFVLGTMDDSVSVLNTYIHAKGMSSMTGTAKYPDAFRCFRDGLWNLAEHPTEYNFADIKSDIKHFLIAELLEDTVFIRPTPLYPREITEDEVILRNALEVANAKDIEITNGESDD